MTPPAKRVLFGASLAIVAFGPADAARASGLYAPSNWSAMAADRAAQRVGDSLTVVIYETSTAQNAAKSGSTRGSQIGASKSSQNNLFDLNSKFGTNAQASRSGKLVAQISVVVDEILPNGDLHVSGQQLLDVGGEKTRINVKGRLRPADIAPDDTILSTRLADAKIEYNGKGFVSAGARPGIVSRVVNWLGLP